MGFDLSKRLQYKDLPDAEKEKRRAAARKWSRANKEHWNKRYKENIARLWQLKADVGCSTCPERDPRCLTFHHKNPAEKSFTISDKMAQSWDVLEKELKKCIVLCFNCHMKLERD